MSCTFGLAQWKQGFEIARFKHFASFTARMWTSNRDQSAVVVAAANIRYEQSDSGVNESQSIINTTNPSLA